MFALLGQHGYTVVESGRRPNVTLPRGQESTMAGTSEVTFSSRAFDRARLARLADWLAAAVAVSLPWSTSATGILFLFLLVALAPTLDIAMLRRELGTAAGGL